MNNSVRQHRLNRRRWSALAVLIVSAVAGFTFVSGAISAQGSDLRPAGGDFASLVSDRADHVADKRARARDLHDTIEKLSRSITDHDITEDRSAVRKLEPESGLTPVKGSGLRVTLTDAPRSVDAEPGTDPNMLVVHQQDLQTFVNALWSGGAEAITLQNQRLISTTGIKCVGNTVVLDGVPYSPPYVIEAIGDPSSLRLALDASPQVDVYREYADQYQLGLDIQESRRMTADAYSSGINLSYAQPAD